MFDTPPVQRSLTKLRHHFGPRALANIGALVSVPIPRLRAHLSDTWVALSLRWWCEMSRAAGLCLLAWLAAACAPPAGSGGASTVTLLYCCGVWSVSPSEDEATKFLLFPPLVERDSTGTLHPKLARRWEHSDDYREWTVWLRSDAMWEDGVPVTAADVKFTFDFYDVYEGAGDAYETEVIDDTTFAIRYEQQALSPLDDWRVILPAHHLAHLDPIDIPRHEWFTHPVSAGPYRLVRSDPDLMMAFEVNPTYFGPRPAIERVIVKFSINADLQEMLSGQADVAPEAAPHDVSKYGDDPRFKRYYRIMPGVHRMLFWNLAHPLFESAEVRRALVAAIDRQELAELLGLPEGLPTLDVLVRDTQYWSGPLPSPVPHDPEAARQLLEQVGWADNDGDGVRAREGRTFRFDALVPVHPGLPEAAEYIQASLRDVGVDMQILTREFSEVQRRIMVGEFEAAFLLLQQERTDRGHARFFGEGSAIGYDNPTVARLIGQAGAVMNPVEIDSLYRATWPIFMEELPAVFLHPTVWATVANRRVGGLSTPFRTDPARFMADLWLEPIRP